MGVTVSSSHVSATPSSSAGGLLTLFPCSSVRSLSRETVLHKLLQRESFQQAAVLHKLPEHWSFLWSTVLQEQAAPAWFSHGITSPGTKPASTWASRSTGLRVLAGACYSTGFPRDHSLLQAYICSGMVSSMGFRWRSAPPWTSVPAGRQPDSPWSSPQAEGEKSDVWSSSSPLLLHMFSLLSVECCSTAGFSSS